MSLIHFAIVKSRLSACLALLAMLLLFIAPVISKSLMAQHGYSSSMMMAHMATMPAAAAEDVAQPSACDADFSEHLPASAAAHHHAASAGNAAAPPVLPAQHHPMSMMDDSACGYCVLLIHLPLDSVRLPQLWTVLQAAIPAVPLHIQPVFTSWIPIGFRPRGPPVNALLFA